MSKRDVVRGTLGAGAAAKSSTWGSGAG